MSWEIMKQICFLLLQMNIAIALNPIILVPGLGGSQIDRKLENKKSKQHRLLDCPTNTKSYEKLWINPRLIGFRHACWMEDMKLVWNMDTMQVSNYPGVLTNVTGFGGTEGVEYLDNFQFLKTFKPLVDFFTNLGYERGKSIRGAPYDFRYSPDQLPHNYHHKLKKLIEETYAMNENQKVNIISHSYGCLVTLYFLSLQTKEWKDTYIKQWFPVGGPFGGAGMTLFGLNFGFAYHFTSTLMMLPSSELWLSDPVIGKSDERAYRLSELDDLLTDIGFPEAVVMRKNIVDLPTLMKTSPGVPIHCMYSMLQGSTPITFSIRKSPKVTLKISDNGDGDHVVNDESLKLCGTFRQNEPVLVSVFDRITHTEMNDEIVLNKLSYLV